MPPVAATASLGRVDPGGEVTFTEALDGPATLEVGCQAPLQVVVSASSGLSVYSGSANAVSGGECGTVTVAAGSRQTYQATWPVDATLPGGDYTATLVLGNAPELTLPVAVGVVPGGCG